MPPLHLIFNRAVGEIESAPGYPNELKFSFTMFGALALVFMVSEVQKSQLSWGAVMLVVMLGSFIPKASHPLKHLPWAGEEADLYFLLQSCF